MTVNPTRSTSPTIEERHLKSGMPTSWKNKMIEQDFNYVDSTIKEMTVFFETRVENLEPKEEKKVSSTAAKKSLKKIKKRKMEDSDSSVVESS